jgi:ligand-binding sensor domain-containing protein/serine phosphatase RsbU (regulator of sigma subunit)
MCKTLSINWIGKNILALFILLFLFMIGTKLAFAQNNQINFEHITQAQGLSNNAIRSILQDKKGFLWIGTEDGINKYDGLNFKVYNYPQSLPSRGIINMIEGKDGSLWCITREFTILKYIVETDTFALSPLSNFIKIRKEQFRTGFVTDEEGLWIGTNEGLLNINPVKNTQTTYFSGQNILAIEKDDKGNFWICGTNVFVYFDPKNGKEIKTEELGQLPPIRGASLAYSKKGILYIGADSGVCIFDTVKNEIVEVLTKKKDDKNSLPDNNISCLLLSDENTLWIGTFGNGACKFDIETRTFTHYQNEPNSSQGLVGQSISTIFIDRTGVLWIGDRSYGLSKASPYKNLFQSYSYKPCQQNSLSNNYIRGIYEDSKGILWVCTQGGGLNKINRKTNEFKHYINDPKKPKSISTNNLWAVYEDSKGILWVAGEKGVLNVYNPVEDNFDAFTFNTKPNGKTLFINVIFEDSKGKLWIGTLQGLYQISADKKDFDLLYDGDFTKNLVKIGVDIQVIFEDSKSNIWVGTDNGLVCFDSNGKRSIFLEDPINQKLSHTFVTSFLEDKDGIIWFATKGKGLVKFDPITKNFSFITESNGLSHDNVYGLLADSEGAFWISSDNGVCKYDPKTKSFETFGIKDGLQGKEFNRRAFFKSSQGEMFFGGTNGLNSFFPQKIKKNPVPPKVAVTELIATGVFKNIPLNNKVELSYTENLISITFAAFDFNAPENNLYSYKLEGFDKAWISVRGRNQITYNLYPGTYFFQVKATNNHQVWNNEPAVLQIVILPPPWRSNTAYFIYVFFVIGTAYLGFTYQTNKIKTLANVREAELRARAAEAQAQANEAQVKVIEAENKRHNEELAYARELQLSLLPKGNLVLDFITVVGQMRTASEVGGDYYDFFELSLNTYCFVIGDATGHGVAAGLVVGMVKSLLVQATSISDNVKSLSASSLMAGINFALKSTINRRGVGMCLTIAIFDVEQLTLEISNAGMPCPIIYSRKNQNTDTLEKLKAPPLGFLKKFSFPSKKIQLEKGDNVIFFSDGFSERMSVDRKIWSYNSVNQQLKGICKTERLAQSIVDKLFSSCDFFAEGIEADDDMTVLVLSTDSNTAQIVKE